MSTTKRLIHEQRKREAVGDWRMPKFVVVLTLWGAYCRGVEVRGIVQGFERCVHVTQGKSLDTFAPEPPTVNVPSFGAVLERGARELAKLITFAADTARRMEAVKEWSQFVLPGGWPTAKIPYVTITKKGPRALP